tara:strand:- start:74 stop:970 length:897 start_codon:yes stop_codon:yes gene_type:complete
MKITKEPITPIYGNLNFLLKNCEGLILDIWGVLWDGIQIYPDAKNTLNYLKKHNIPVVLLSNAPRKSSIVRNKLENIGITSNLYNEIISSGDVCKSYLINQYPNKNKYFFIGLKEDNDLLKDTQFIEVKSYKKADFILLTGLRSFDDTPEEYVEELKKCISQQLPMFCANPDKIIMRQNGKKIFCAGAIANIYENLGGIVKSFGKPYNNVFLEAINCLKKINPNLNLNNLSIIGDGLETDILGGNDSNINTVLVTSGILSHIFKTKYGEKPNIDLYNKTISSSKIIPNYAITKFKINS